jgi:hypothetical protein
MKVEYAAGRVLVKSDHRTDTFIYAQRDAVEPGFTRIEFVRSGLRQFVQRVTNVRAPARIVEIARGERL